MKTASTVIADLTAALDGARASGRLKDADAFLVVRVPPNEYATLDGEEIIESDSPDAPIRYKQVYRGEDGDLLLLACSEG